MVRYIESRRGFKLVDDDNFTYDQHKKNTDGTKQYWMCTDRNCKARLHTNVTANAVECHILKKVSEHNHAAISADIRASQLMSQIKTDILHSQVAPRVAISNATSGEDECVKAALPSTAALSRNIRRWRQKERRAPAIPTSRTGFDIPAEYCNLDGGKQFLRYDSGSDDNERILIFSTDQGLDDLVKYSSWACDGTFKVSPSFYYQLYTLHIQCYGCSVPRLLLSCQIREKKHMTNYSIR